MGCVCFLVKYKVSRFTNIIGKVGKESAAAKFAAATPANDFSIQEDKPYAEVLLSTGGWFVNY